MNGIARMSKIISLAVLIMFLSVSFTCAEEAPAKEIDPSLTKDIAEFLTAKGYSHIEPIGGEDREITNGHLLKVEGIDKENKKYAIEIVCTEDYSQWILLMVQEDDTDSQDDKEKKK